MSPAPVKSKKNPTAIDLFSGCGGLTLGLKQAGFRVVGAVEIDSVATETYKHNHPEVLVWQSDIRNLNPDTLRSELKMKKGELVLLSGCPPWQGFSSIRPFNGGRTVRDERNDLVFDFLRFVKAFEPKTVMMENVPALAKDRRIKTFMRHLRSMGYSATCTVLNAADFGVPQRRRRMILLAGKKKVAHAIPANKIATVRDAIGHLPRPGKTGDPLHDYPEKRSSAVMDLIKLIPKNGGSRRNMGSNFQLACHKRCPGGFKDIYGRMKWDEPSPTMTGGCTNPSKGRFLHPQQNRAITLREAALLQTFPPDYYFSLSSGKQGASLMIGNALPPRFIKLHAKAIKSIL